MHARESVLKIIGLSDNEATVYTALSQKAAYATAHQLAAQTGMKRSTVHDNLRSLTRKRLVNRKIVRRGNQAISQYHIRDRRSVVRRIQQEVARQLSTQQPKG